jgi:hypothetical protein
MSNRIAGWIELATLPLVLALWSPSPNYGTLVHVAVFAAAWGIAFQTGKAGRYFLATAFAAIAVLFNPIVPVMLSPDAFFLACWASAGIFVFALLRLKKRERVPIASISAAIRRSESVEAVWAWKH